MATQMTPELREYMDRVDKAREAAGKPKFDEDRWLQERGDQG